MLDIRDFLVGFQALEAAHSTAVASSSSSTSTSSSSPSQSFLSDQQAHGGGKGGGDVAGALGWELLRKMLRREPSQVRSRVKLSMNNRENAY